MGTRSIWLRTGGLFALVVLSLLLAAVPVAAATPSELLQKAIYTEETVGDVDAAIKLYEQVVAEGKTAQDAAAQAQYRLALCYEKKGSDADAKAAFEALIENYPNAKDLVAEARKHLPTKELKLLAAPWQFGERMQLNMTLPTGLPIGTMTYMVDAAKHDGHDVTRCSTRGMVTINNTSTYSEVLCETDSFQPIESLWKHTLLGEARAEYGETSVKIDVAGKDKPFTIAFEPPVFDNEECVELFRRLPLAVDYKTTLTVITSLGGSQIKIPISVPATESITVPAGTFECYKVELGLVNQKFWISNDEHRYVVRFAAGGVSADLAKVWQAEPDQGEKISNDAFSLTLPLGWLSYDATNKGKPDEVSFLLLDPRGEATTQIAVRPTSTLKESERGSTKAWTEAFIKEIQQVYVDFKVADSGMKEIKVAGQPATEIVADFTDGGKPMRMLGVAVIGETSAATLRFTTQADEFDALRKDFDAIVASFQLK